MMCVENRVRIGYYMGWGIFTVKTVINPGGYF